MTSNPADQASSEVLNQRLETIAELNTQFLSAQTEAAVISAFMQAALKLTRALGASFIPMDDDGRPLTLISKGIVAQEPDIAAWEKVLDAPPIRTQCRVCLKQQLISDTCPLFSNPISNTHKIYCVRLTQNGTKLGILNLYLPTDSLIDSCTKTFLQTLADNTTLALGNLRLQRKYRQGQDQSTNHALNTEIKTEIEQAAITAERMRLGREIHDGLAQILGYVKLELSQMEGMLQAGDEDKLVRAIQISHQAIAEAFVEAREAIDDLRNTSLSDTFTPWLLETTNNFQESFDITTEIGDFPADLDFHLETKNQLTRIVQEALSNIRKHAQGKNVLIAYYQSPTHAIITLQDDGVGFEVEAAAQNSRHGLQGMRERAELIHSNLEITSKPGEGTRVQIEIPREAVL